MECCLCSGRAPLIVVCAVVTPDGMVISRSLLHGGKAAETTDIMNNSTFVNALRGMFCRLISGFFFFVINGKQLLASFPKRGGTSRLPLGCTMELGVGYNYPTMLSLPPLPTSIPRGINSP